VGTISEDANPPATEDAADAAADASLAADDSPAALRATINELTTRLDMMNRQAIGLRHRQVELTRRFMAVHAALIETRKSPIALPGDPSPELAPVEINPNPDAALRVVVFGSMGAGVEMPLALPPRQFRGVLADRNCELVFLKDFRQCWYLQGLVGISQDIPTTADFLRKLLLEDDKRPFVMLGASSGGYAALLFGAMLGAQRVVAFSPQTEITRKAIGLFGTLDTSLDERDLAAQFTSLKKVLDATPLTGAARIYYSRRNDFDSSEAAKIKDAAHVELCPVEWNGHNTAKILRDRGEMDGIVDFLVAGASGA
jgi:hypothetical protein